MSRVFVRQESDGAVRVLQDGEKWTSTSEYMWSEGNYACDCNRASFFGHDVDFDSPVSCGECKFSVKIEDASGRVLYQDERWARRSAPTPPIVNS